MIAIRALGPAEVTVNGASAPAELLWKKNLALLVYLARSPKRARAREHLIGLLWGDKADEKARRSLNEALSELRRFGGDGVLRSDNAQVRLAPGAVELDTDALEALAAAGEYAGAAALVRGEFLDGFAVRGAQEFDIWLAAERDHWRRRSVDVLVRNGERLLAAADIVGAIDVLRHALALDSRSEAALRAMMRALTLAGDRAAALALYEAFAASLKEELGAEPDAETRALADRVRRERAPRPILQPGAAQAAPPRAPLVGRGDQLRSMVDAWTGCKTSRRAAVVVVEGDAGTGKTRLAEELAARARLDGAVLAAVRSVEADGGDAWSGAFGIARGGLLDAPGAAGAPPPMLAQLRGAAPPESLGRAFSEVLHAVADEQPVLVFVDDAHWLDRESLLAVGAAARDVARSPVLFVFTAARAPQRPELDELRTRVGRELLGTVIKLTPLGRDEVRELARLALPRYTADELDRLTRRVLADSAGIALLVVALLSAVAGGLSLDERAKAWPEANRTLNDTLPGELPDNVVAAIRINYRRLSANAQLVLVAAAVLGGRVSAVKLGRASRLTGDALAQALDDLEWQGWLMAEGRGYAFVARIVRDVIERDMVVPGERQRIRDAAEGTA